MNEALFQSALRAQAAGKSVEAVRLCQDILRSDPRHFNALYMLGFLHSQFGRFEEAQHFIGEAIKINPQSFDALYNRGVALQGLKRDEDALLCFDKALALKPDLAVAHVNRAGALLALKRHEEALAACDRALRLDAANPDAWNNRGNALTELKRNAEALSCFDKTLALNPAHAEAWSNRGILLNRMGRFAEAIASFDKSQAIKPDNVAILCNRATACAGLKRFDEAAAAFERALAIDPDLPYVPGDLAMNRFQCCDWRFADADRALLAAGVRMGKPIVQPQIIEVLSPSPDVQLQCARLWVAAKCPPAPKPLWRGERYGHDKIRIAYLSADFWAHATAFLMAGVFEQHDKARFESTAISFGADKKDAMRSRLVNAFGRFIDVRDRSDREVAALLREMQIDIAIDLKGYTGDARPGIFAHRPAPLQVNYLGFPGTMGSPYIDYILADRVLIPEGQEIHYAERIVYLPDSYQANDASRSIAERAPTRREAGLPEKGFVFCSFNNNYKITPEMFDIWMRILRRVEGSVLWQLTGDSASIRNLRREAEAHGVSADRLVFAPRVKPDEHLARQRLGDLFLDTLPCNAHTTASDALWAGLPVLSCPGSTFAGRVAASLLQAVGLPELMVDSLFVYESLAIKLGTEPVMLAALKAKLARNRMTAPLFDTIRFTRHLEAAYLKMWQRAETGEKPASFAVPAGNIVTKGTDSADSSA